MDIFFTFLYIWVLSCIVGLALAWRERPITKLYAISLLCTTAFLVLLLAAAILLVDLLSRFLF